jgi:hypothetical protein
MRKLVSRPLICLVCAIALVLSRPCDTFAADLTARQVVDSIEKAKKALLTAQQQDGSWKSAEGHEQYRTGITSLVLLALLNTGMTATDPPVKRGLDWLRRQEPTFTYEISLMIQALAAAKDGKRDVAKVTMLVRDLEDSQIRQGPNAGSWSYNKGLRQLGGGDRSNGQFAVLALREAQEMGVPVSLETWRHARQHWLSSQNGDGGWSYSGPGAHRGSTGSMTVAGIATMVITHAMLRAQEKELDATGAPICCAEPRLDKPLEDACRWLGNSFQVTNNPGDGRWLLYYLYGLERAGRFSGRRFFINSRGQRHDWYREGADYLVKTQNLFAGTWKEGEQESMVGTSFALMFLSKGLAPVLINKLQYGPHDPNHKNAVIAQNWNRHPDDVRNLTQYISGRPKWPKLLTWQTVEVSQATLADLLQAPIVFFNGTDPPEFTPNEVTLLRDYIMQGGFLFVDNCCRSQAFDEAFRDLVRQMFPPSEAPLKKLTADHPVFRSEFNLLDEKTGEPSAELWGVDVGCRTSIMYSPNDLSCLWDKWTSFVIPERPKELLSMITKATSVGVNVVAYVTGREVLNKIEQQERVPTGITPDRVERDLLQISKIRYTGDWDAAPQALRNLLLALNRAAGMAASTKVHDLTLVDPGLFRVPITYMHGRNEFALGRAEQDKLRDYLKQGGVLFADACCGLPAFDRSFRRLMEQVFPDNPLKRIPPDHEMFSGKLGYDLKTVKRREPDVDNPNAAMGVSVRNVEPFLEGIEIDGRYVVVYSKYDISCALERQASVACTGYIHEDAVRIGVNVILYFMNQ